MTRDERRTFCLGHFEAWSCGDGSQAAYCRRHRLSPMSFWLHYKRIEQGRFHWPAADTDRRGLVLAHRELEWLLEGLAVEQPAAHQPLGCDRLC